MFYIVYIDWRSGNPIMRSDISSSSLTHIGVREFNPDINGDNSVIHYALAWSSPSESRKEMVDLGKKLVAQHGLGWVNDPKYPEDYYLYLNEDYEEGI